MRSQVLAQSSSALSEFAFSILHGCDTQAQLGQLATTVDGTPIRLEPNGGQWSLFIGPHGYLSINAETQAEVFAIAMGMGLFGHGSSVAN